MSYNLKKYWYLNIDIYPIWVYNINGDCMNCNKCSEIEKSNNIKKTYRKEEEKSKLIKRLNIIEGQIRGINNMVKDDRYCGDILIQIAAVNEALKSLGNNILSNHLKTCVVNEIKEGNNNSLDEVMNLIKKLQ